MTIESLFAEGHLKHIPPSRASAEKSIQVAEKYLSEAEKSMGIEVYDLTVIAAYNAIFHSARAILFVDGVGERSHAAIFEYLLEKHKDFGVGLINASDLYRKLRHSVSYGLDTQAKKEDGENIVEFASEFIEKTKSYLKM